MGKPNKQGRSGECDRGGAGARGRSGLGGNTQKRSRGRFILVERERERGKGEGRGLDSPLEVDRGDVEDHSFEPQDHEEPLGEGAVPDALAIAARLQWTRQRGGFIGDRVSAIRLST